MLTDQEKKLLFMIHDFWNAFLELPVVDSADVDEMCRDVHDIENRILARPASLEFKRECEQEEEESKEEK